TDKRLNIWYVDIEKSTPVKVDTNPYEDPTFQFSLNWSPDSQWLAYDRLLQNHLSAIFAYSPETAKSTQITDGMSDARYPVFDKGGKLLFFAAMLKKGEPSPVQPESDEEKVGAEKKDEKANGADKNQKAEGQGKEAEKKEDEGKKGEKRKEETPKVVIDFDGIGQRIVALPIKASNYVGLEAGKAGTLFLAEIAEVPSLTAPNLVKVSKFDLKERKTEPFADGLSAFMVS